MFNTWCNTNTSSKCKASYIIIWHHKYSSKIYKTRNQIQHFSIVFCEILDVTILMLIHYHFITTWRDTCTFYHKLSISSISIAYQVTCRTSYRLRIIRVQTHMFNINIRFVTTLNLNNPLTLFSQKC